MLYNEKKINGKLKEKFINLKTLILSRSIYSFIGLPIKAQKKVIS